MREKNPINIEVGKNLKRLRENAGHTQETLSECLGISSNHLSTLERGVCALSPELIKKICETLKISSDMLIFGEIPSDDITMELAQRLARIKPQYRFSLFKLLNDLEELLTIKEDSNSQK